MARRAAWVMSEADTLGLLNDIDDRLALRGLDQRQVDALVRLRAILEEDVARSARPETLGPAKADASRAAA